jgi:hypothetical protein
MKYIAVMTDLIGLDDLMVKLGRLNVNMVSVSSVSRSTGGTVSERDRPGDGTANPLSGKVWVGLIAGDGVVDAALRTILKPCKDSQAEVMELADGLFGGLR